MWSRCKTRSTHEQHSVNPTAPLGQCTRAMTLQAVGTALVRSHAILKSLLITLTSHQIHTKSAAPVWPRCKTRSTHERHSVNPTAPLGQCTRGMTLQAVGTALVRSHAILKSLLITLTSHRICRSRVVAVQDQIDARAAQRQSDGSAGPVHPCHDSPSRRHCAGALTRHSEVAAHPLSIHTAFGDW